MPKAKRFFWMRLYEGFFDRKQLKFLRSQPCGDSLIVLYLRLLLRSLNTRGELEYGGIFSSFEEELAFDLEENAEKVTQLLLLLEKCSLAVRLENGAVRLLEVEELVGSESSAAGRMRTMRKKKQESSTSLPFPEEEDSPDVQNS